MSSSVSACFARGRGDSPACAEFDTSAALAAPDGAGVELGNTSAVSRTGRLNADPDRDYRLDQCRDRHDDHVLAGLRRLPSHCVAIVLLGAVSR